MRHTVVTVAQEDPTNFWPVDRAARALVTRVLRAGVSANAISIAGFLAGAVAALTLDEASGVEGILLSFAMSAVWLLADTLDGMVARANGTASAIGRELDGLCDHGVFLLLYVALAKLAGGPAGWLLVVVAAGAHVVQANVYEVERGRFKRRAAGALPTMPNHVSRNPLVRFYDRVAGFLESRGAAFDRLLGTASERTSLVACYRARATGGFRVLTGLSADARILILYAARLLGSPRTFCWIEIGPMSAATALGIWWHRRTERRAIAAAGAA